MKKLSYKISYYVLYVLFAVVAVVLGLFYFGGSEVQPIVVDMDQPAYTDTLLYLTYGLFGLTVIVTLIAFLFQFGVALKDNPINALKSLIGVILIVAVLIISWSVGSEEKLYMPGYDGIENEPFWLKLTDMFLYTIYFLLGITLLAMIASGVKKKLS
ncbi:hypothetical protein EZS27_022627 [termite gut metagenome]|uniref:Uncharacterized protein n=1 Tax=termite gut metagenome TaxID=433724 RepID=A0A5J4R5V7_9ZZZZ